MGWAGLDSLAMGGIELRFVPYIVSQWIYAFVRDGFVIDWPRTKVVEGLYMDLDTM